MGSQGRICRFLLPKYCCPSLHLKFAFIIFYFHFFRDWYFAEIFRFEVFECMLDYNVIDVTATNKLGQLTGILILLNKLYYRDTNSP